MSPDKTAPGNYSGSANLIVEDSFIVHCYFLLISSLTFELTMTSFQTLWHLQYIGGRPGNLSCDTKQAGPLSLAIYHVTQNKLDLSHWQFIMWHKTSWTSLAGNLSCDTKPAGPLSLSIYHVTQNKLDLSRSLHWSLTKIEIRRPGEHTTASCSQTPPKRGRIWGHSADSLGFIKNSYISNLFVLQYKLVANVCARIVLCHTW